MGNFSSYWMRSPWIWTVIAESLNWISFVHGMVDGSQVNTASHKYVRSRKTIQQRATPQTFVIFFRTAAVIGAHCCKTCKRYFEVRIKSRRHNEPEEAPQHLSCQHSRPQKSAKIKNFSKNSIITQLQNSAQNHAEQLFSPENYSCQLSQDIPGYGTAMAELSTGNMDGMYLIYRKYQINVRNRYVFHLYV